MNKKRWEKVKRLFGRTRQVPPDRRRAFLARECGGDDSLVLEVLRLLEREDTAGQFLDPPVDAELSRPLQSAASSLCGVRLGDFELMEVIGHGAMGVVYLARQHSLDRNVAVKILAQHLCASPERRERFRREALAASRLRHPNIVTILSFGEHKGLHYIAMEYIAGKSLREVLGEGPRPRDDAREGDTSPIQPVVAAKILRGLAQALEHCHGLGIIHRDIKPHNILLDAAGEPRLVDFGLAKDTGLESISQPGSVVGTPHYMSPEQAQALGSGVDHRTDIYSAGAVLYELLTLHKPFEGLNSPAVLYSITHERPRSIAEFAPKVPSALAAICMKAMGRRPESRYQHASELALDLERFLHGERVRAPRPSIARQAYELVFFGHPRMAASVLVVVFALLVALSPRQTTALAAGSGTRSEVSERSKPEVLLPPSRDEKVLQAWRRQMKHTIEEGLKELPQEPVYH